MEQMIERPRSSFQFEYPSQQTPAPVSNSVPKVHSELPTILANATILLHHEENDLGFALLRQALKLDSHHAATLKQLAGYHTKQRAWAQAAAALENAVKSDYSFDTLAQLAEKYYLLGQDEKAIQKYEEALAIVMNASPLLFDVHKNLGNLLCRQGDLLGAEENYFKAFAIDSKSDTCLVNLGTLEVQRGDFEKALEKFRAALELNPRNDKAWVGLAIVHEKMGDIDLAWANIENAADLAPGNRTAVHILSAWSLKNNKHLAAIEALQDYLASVDQDEEMSLALIHLFCLTEQFDLARLEIERVLLWNPRQQDVLALLESLPRDS